MSSGLEESPFLQPSPRLLRQLFTERRACTVAEAAELVGFGVDWVTERIAEQDVVLDASNRVPWDEVALWFLRAWPPRLRDRMLDGIEGWPEMLRLTRVEWMLPRYIVVALERSALEERSEATDAHDLTFEHWLSDQLHYFLDDMDLRGGLLSDPALLEAYLFPPGNEDQQDQEDRED